MRITAGAPHMADAVARQRLNSRRIRGACESLAPHPTAFIWSAPKASGLDRRAQPHSSRPRPTEQRHAHAHTHGHSGCGVGRPVVRRKRPSRAASEKRRVWGHRRVSRARIAAGGGLRATSSCLSALVSPPHAHHGRCTARGRCTCSAAAEFASHLRCLSCQSLAPSHSIHLACTEGIRA